MLKSKNIRLSLVWKMLSRRACHFFAKRAIPARRSLQSSGASGQQQLAHLKKLGQSDREALAPRLAAIVGEKNVSLADAVRSQHGQDEGPDKGVNPDVVAFPESTEQVSEVRRTRTSNANHMLRKSYNSIAIDTHAS